MSYIYINNINAVMDMTGSLLLLLLFLLQQRYAQF
jgi:hypothetical protein